MKQLVNQVINELFRQLTLTLTLELDVPVRPKDTKGLNFFLSSIKTKAAIKFPKKKKKLFFSTENWLGAQRVNRNTDGKDDGEEFNDEKSPGWQQ